MKHPIRLMLAVLSLIAAACTGSPADSARLQMQGGVSASLTLRPDPPSVMQSAELELSLHDAKGEPVTGAQVQFDLTMPAMEMPENRVDAVEAEAGSYVAKTLFTMSGEWQIEASVLSAGESTSFIFNVSLK
jgi:nitrogen fixation protein FixH